MSKSPKHLLDPDLIRRDLEINQFDLDSAMIRQPGLFAHYAQLAARFDREVNKYEQFCDVVEAKLDRECRDKAAADGAKMTEAQIKSLVRIDPRMIKAIQALNEAKENAAVAKSTAEALRHRRDMLIQLAFNHREESKGQMGVTGDQRLRAAADVRAARVEQLRAAQACNNEQEG